MFEEREYGMVTWCILYTTNGETKYIEIDAATKQKAIRALIQKTDLNEFEYAIWRKICG
jgi:hypothetical protein